MPVLRPTLILPTTLFLPPILFPPTMPVLRPTLILPTRRGGDSVAAAAVCLRLDGGFAPLEASCRRVAGVSRL